MNRRKIWQLPNLRLEGDIDKHRPVTWLELFFDLFFVAVIASLAHELSSNLTLEGIKNFTITFIPVWWVWIGTTYYNERFETEGIENRVFTFLLMIALSGMAVFSHDALGNNLRAFLASYLVARLVIIYLWARAGYYDKQFRPTSVRYIIGFSVSVLLVAIAILLDSKTSLVLFPIALVIDVVTPISTIKHQKQLPRYTNSKMPERFGLFAIIVLGEIVVGVINGLSTHHHFTIEMVPLGIMGIFTALGMWWLYFDFIGRRPFKRNILVAMSWSYLHMPLMLFFVLLGAGLDNLIAEGHGHAGSVNSIYLVCLGIALVLIGLIELTLERAKDEPSHKVFSPLYKFVTGIAGISLGILHIFHSPKAVMLAAIVLILINIFYGAYVWFNQKVEKE